MLPLHRSRFRSSSPPSIWGPTRITTVAPSIFPRRSASFLDMYCNLRASLEDPPAEIQKSHRPLFQRDLTFLFFWRVSICFYEIGENSGYKPSIHLAGCSSFMMAGFDRKSTRYLADMTGNTVPCWNVTKQGSIFTPKRSHTSPTMAIIRTIVRVYISNICF